MHERQTIATDVSVCYVASLGLGLQKMAAWIEVLFG